MQYVYTDGNNKDFVILCKKLDNFLNEISGGEENRSQYVEYNKLEDIHDVIIIYINNTPVGCAAFKHYDDKTAEIKRVFIIEEYRRKGLSNQLMSLLENKAKEKGYKKLILETGEPLDAAMKLYSNIGYKIIPNYGQYKDMEESICMEKNI